jgi:putative redox protein
MGRFHARPLHGARGFGYQVGRLAGGKRADYHPAETFAGRRNTLVKTITSYAGDLHCEIVHAPSGAAFATDAPKDNQGKGESFSPTDLVGAALGSCILTTMAIVARPLGIELGGATASVDKEMAAAPTRRIAKLTVHIEVPHDVPVEQREQLERAAHRCPVHKSLNPEIEIPITFAWGTEAA